MQDWKRRLLVENTELKQRIEKLEAFLVGDGASEVDQEDYTLMTLQLIQMKAYQGVLQMREIRMQTGR